MYFMLTQLPVMYIAPLSVTTEDKGDFLRPRGKTVAQRCEDPDALPPGVAPGYAHLGGKFKRPFGTENVRRQWVWSFLPFFSGYYFAISGRKKSNFKTFPHALLVFSLLRKQSAIRVRRGKRVWPL